MLFYTDVVIHVGLQHKETTTTMEFLLNIIAWSPVAAAFIVAMHIASAMFQRRHRHAAALPYTVVVCSSCRRLYRKGQAQCDHRSTAEIIALRWSQHEVGGRHDAQQTAILARGLNARSEQLRSDNVNTDVTIYS